MAEDLFPVGSRSCTAVTVKLSLRHLLFFSREMLGLSTGGTAALASAGGARRHLGVFEDLLVARKGTPQRGASQMGNEF